MSRARGTAPAFQLYASDLLSKRDYRMMSLAERGLLLSMLCECWANKNLPSSPQGLSDYLGKPEVSHVLSDRVKSFFVESGGEFISPDLEEYRVHVLDQRQRMSDGGRNGGKKRAEKQREGRSPPSSHLTQKDQATLKGRERESEHEHESESEHDSQERGNNLDELNDEWVRSYDQASNGY